MIRVSYGPKGSERIVAFERPVVRFGKGLSCDIRLEHGTWMVALHHGDFVLVGGRYKVVDRNNGLWVNGQQVQEQILVGGERIRVGAPDGAEILVLESSDARIAVARTQEVERHPSPPAPLPAFTRPASAPTAASRPQTPDAARALSSLVRGEITASAPPAKGPLKAPVPRPVEVDVELTSGEMPAPPRRDSVPAPNAAPLGTVRRPEAQAPHPVRPLLGALAVKASPPNAAPIPAPSPKGVPATAAPVRSVSAAQAQVPSRGATPPGPTPAKLSPVPPQRVSTGNKETHVGAPPPPRSDRPGGYKDLLARSGANDGKGAGATAYPPGTTFAKNGTPLPPSPTRVSPLESTKPAPNVPDEGPALGDDFDGDTVIAHVAAPSSGAPASVIVRSDSSPRTEDAPHPATPERREAPLTRAKASPPVGRSETALPSSAPEDNPIERTDAGMPPVEQEETAAGPSRGDEAKRLAEQRFEAARAQAPRAQALQDEAIGALVPKSEPEGARRKEAPPSAPSRPDEATAKPSAGKADPPARRLGAPGDDSDEDVSIDFDSDQDEPSSAATAESTVGDDSRGKAAANLAEADVGGATIRAPSLSVEEKQLGAPRPRGEEPKTPSRAHSESAAPSARGMGKQVTKIAPDPTLQPRAEAKAGDSKKASPEKSSPAPTKASARKAAVETDKPAAKRSPGKPAKKVAKATSASPSPKTPAPPPTPDTQWSDALATEVHPGVAAPRKAPPGPGPSAVSTLARKLAKIVKPHEEVQHWLKRAEEEIAFARARNRGLSSGHTMVIMARAMAGLRQNAEGRTRKVKRILGMVLAASLVVVFGLSGVIWVQRQRITQLVKEKVAIDSQIQNIFDQMVAETDEGRLQELEARLEVLMGKATEKVAQVSKTSAARAKELAEPVDELEQEIRKILRSFNAETYAIPPIFKQALQQSIDEIVASGGLDRAVERKAKYWPKIQAALSKKQLPEALGYIAYAESRFDPAAVNTKSRASGMWQFMEDAARQCGLTVNETKDERFDPARSSDGAACYLSKLLVEFGEESFMLALASYNRGENGVRRALHKLAKEPGGYRKRDFWQLYRLKLLPEETRAYVPKVLAAAIVLGNPEKYAQRTTATPGAARSN